MKLKMKFGANYRLLKSERFLIGLALFKFVANNLPLGQTNQLPGKGVSLSGFDRASHE